MEKKAEKILSKCMYADRETNISRWLILMTSQKLGAVIFSRYDSQRLPGKALLSVQNNTLLGIVVDRCKLVLGVEDVIVATTSRDVDDKIVRYCEQKGVKVYRGATDNLIIRSIGVCRDFGLDGLVRVCGDRPFLDPKMISDCVSLYSKDNTVDLLSNNLDGSVVPGLTVEILSYRALQKLNKLVVNEADKEHLTKYIYENQSRFEIVEFGLPRYIKNSTAGLVVDTQNDLEKINWIYSYLEDNTVDVYDTQKVVGLAERWEEQ